MKKNVLLGVSGGIAAYKSCEIVSGLRKLGYDVKVIMTENAKQFITPLTFETLSKNEVVTDMFAEKAHYEVEHISLANWAGVFLIAPATENVIAKFANGIADDMLSTVYAATTAPKILCPAMNVEMYRSEANLNNIRTLEKRGVTIVEPTEGLLACGDIGKGRMEEPSEIIRKVDELLTPRPDLRGQKILITAGGTTEDIDGVRFIGNHSSGKMGFALAESAMERGAEVTVVCGRVSVDPPKGCEIIRVKSTQDMFDAVVPRVNEFDVFVMSAAPADYRVKNKAAQKIKTEKVTLELEKNPDIAQRVGELKGDKKLIVFAAETNDLLENAANKLLKKNADMIVANDVTAEGAGFDCDTNIVTLIYRNGMMDALPMMTKREVADAIFDGLTAI